jgi:hypothetical protein
LTQFESGDMTTEDHQVTSPTNEQFRQDTASNKGIKDRQKKKKSSGFESEDEEEEEKRQERERKEKKWAEEQLSGERREPSSNEIVPIDNATDGVFSQLLLESILEQKSVTDFVGGLPDKRGTLLVRFPTTLLGKSWKRRYFTLHGESLYFHEDQAFIHPALGAGSMSLNADAGLQGVNYDKCKRIDIANFWIIDATGENVSAAALAAAANSPSHTTLQDREKEATILKMKGNQSYASAVDEQEIVDPDQMHTPKQHTPKKSKFQSVFSRNKKKGGAENVKEKEKETEKSDREKEEEKHRDETVRGGERKEKEKEKEKEKDESDVSRKHREDREYEIAAAAAAAVAAGQYGKSGEAKGDIKVTGKKVEKHKEDGPIVRGRRRSSLVNEKGSTSILLIPKDKSGGDAVELTGLNEGSMADLTTLNEWVMAINARIALLNFLHSPMNARSMARGGREILAFLTDASCQRLKIANKFTDLTPVLSHFREALSHRSFIEISFTNCAMTDEALIALAEILEAAPDMKVNRLDLSHNLISKASMGAMHRALKKNNHVGALILDHNQIGDEGVRILVHGEEDAVNEVGGADVAANNSFWTSGMALNVISLAHNQLTDQGLETLLTSIQEFGSRESEDSASGISFALLDFSGNMLTDVGVAVLAGFLLRIPRVESLSLAGNSVTDIGAASLRDVLTSDASSLISLDLKDCQLSSVGLGFLLDGLESLHRKRRVQLELSGNANIDHTGLQRLLSLKGNVWPVHINSLAFSVYDPAVMAGRGGVDAAPIHSPKLHLSERASSPLAVASISSSQQNVLSLFSPHLPSGPTSHLIQPMSTHPSQPNQAAKIVPAAAAVAGSKSMSSSVSSPISSGKKKGGKSKKERKRSAINDPTAPKIAIADTPISRGEKLAIQPLHPPPEFTEPQQSPEGINVDIHAASAAAGVTPSSTRSNNGTQQQLPITTPAIGTPGPSSVDEEEHHGDALVPAAGGERKPRGMNRA